MKLSNTALRELSKQYRSILKKCFLLNIIFVPFVAFPIHATTAITIDDGEEHKISGVVENYDGIKTTTGGENYTKGGAYFVKKGSILMDDSVVFKDNTAPKNGGEIFAYQADWNAKGAINLNISGASFTNNKALGEEAAGATGTGAGGAIYARGLEVSTPTNLFIDKTVFNGNEGKNGGAVHVSYSTHTSITNSEFNNNTADSGGALSVAAGDVSNITSSKFNSNIAHSNGGAIMDNAHGIRLIENSRFENNIATNQGGAIYVTQGTASNYTDIKNSIFTDNHAIGSTASYGGALYGEYGKISGTTFTGNKSFHGGAIHTSRLDEIDNCDFIGNQVLENSANPVQSHRGAGALYVSSTTIAPVIKNSNFKDNIAYGVGGAINHWASGTSARIAQIADTKFEGNTSIYGWGGALINTANIDEIVRLSTPGSTSKEAIFKNNTAVIGGAIANAPRELGENNGTALISLIDGYVFEGNKANAVSAAYIRNSDGDLKGTSTGFSKGLGGAIYNQGTIGNLVNAVFNNNTADFGGAIYNAAEEEFAPDKKYAAGTMNISDTVFTNNAASDLGGAIYNAGILNFSGRNTFIGNKANNVLNDIHNDGILNISGDLTLDGGIAGTGNITFAEGSSLTAELQKTTILANSVTFAGNNTLNLTVANGLANNDYDFIEAEELNGEDKVTIAENAIYNLKLTEEGKINVSVKSGEELLKDTPATAQEANTISAFVATAGEGTAKGNAIANQISSLMQTGHKDSAVKLAEEVAPTTSQTVMGVAQGVNSILNNVAGTRMAAVGRNGGDAFVGGAMWIQGLLNHTKQDSTSNAAGFTADTNGISFGIDGKVNENLMIGIGYGYTNTDADSGARDIDVDGHNFFAYTEYKPNKWYINGMFNYGFSKYDEQKVAGLQAKYDVNTYAANVMTGYDFDSGITPEVGLRYLLADQESYNDGVQRISTDKTDVLTGVVGVKYKADVKAKDWMFTPNLHLAATYDMMSDDSKSNVNIIGGGNYQITGEHLERFGVETGIGIETTYKDLNLSLDYSGGFRKDFQSHTGTLKAKYNF